MSPAGRRGVLIGGVAVMIAIVVVAVLSLTGGNSTPPASAGGDPTAGIPAPDPRSAADQFLQALAAGNPGGAALLTDDRRAASAALTDAWHALDPDQLRTTLRGVGPATGNTASGAYTMAWTIRAGHVWTYDGTLGLVGVGGVWRVHWTPGVLHPSLGPGQRLALVTDAPDEAVVVDRDGKPLVLAGSGGTHLADQNAFAPLRPAIMARVPGTTPGVLAVERVDGAGHDLQTLFGSTSVPTKPLHSTLSVAVQSAAQSAVDGYAGPAVIVAIQPSDGGLLAVAANSRSTGSPFSGLYAPGSTFKIVTATAALEAGTAAENSPLACPLTAHIGTRTISNEGFALGTTTMHYAFARSCNTTFGQLASRLPADGLTAAADQYGLNADFAIPGLPTQTGKVVPPANPDQQVEDGIGQGNVQVSPFGEAVMAATVAAGRAVTPRLWQDAATGVVTGYTAPPSSVLASLRPMMREVVTAGTATGLAGSGPVYDKTGTAQVAGAPAHGWFVGCRGDLAFVVFLEDANDSHPAVSVAATFLAGVH